MVDDGNPPHGRLAAQHRQQRHAVGGDAGRRRLADDVGQRRVQIGLRHGGGGVRTRLDHPRPPHQERDAVTALVNFALHAAPVAVRAVAVPVIPRDAGVMDVILDAGAEALHARAVVRGEEQQRVVADAGAVEGVEHLADRPVHLRHQVAVGTEARRAAEALGGDQRHVGSHQREVEEERGFFLRGPVDEGHRLLGQAVEHLFAVEEVGRSGGEPIVADIDFGLLLEVAHQPEELVEAAVDGTVRDRAREVDVVVVLRGLDPRQGGKVPAQVPLADRRGAVPVRLQQRAQRRAVGLDQRGDPRQKNASLQPRPPRVPSREEPVARRRADRRRRVRVGEAHALVGEAVDAGRGHRRGRIHRPDVAPAEVVGENDHHVRRRAGRGPGRVRTGRAVLRERGRRPTCGTAQDRGQPS